MDTVVFTTDMKCLFLNNHCNLSSKTVSVNLLIPCLSLAQGHCAGSGKKSFSGISIRILAEWNLLDCVGALHPAVPCCETTIPALGTGCYRGKYCRTCAFLFSLVVVLHYKTKLTVGQRNKEHLVVANSIL